MDLIEVKDTESFGKALFATTDIDPGHLGFEIFREEALIIFPPHDKSLVPPWGLMPNVNIMPERAWSDYVYFKQQTEVVQGNVLSLYADLDCEDARRAHAFVDAYLNSSANIFTQLLMVNKFNAVQMNPTKADGSGEGEYLGHGLFQVACRMSHSCRPNSVWFTSQDGRSKIIRALQPIRAGEMITIFYLDQRLLERPIFLRRQDLQKTKNFVCQCTRCLAAEGDDMRRFFCHEKQQCATGEHRVKQGNAEETPELLPCNVCGKLAPNTYKEAMLEIERKHYFEKVSDLKQVLSLQPPHPHHGLAMRVYRAQSELLERMGQIRQAIETQRMWIDCRTSLHGKHYCDQRTGFAYERLGDLLQKENDLEASEIAYQKAVQALQICRGDSSDPLTMCAMKKLIAVQMLRMQLAGGKDPPARKNVDDEPICGLCGIPDPRNKRCARCKLVFYCNRSHQVVHFKVHKKTCCLG